MSDDTAEFGVEDGRKIVKMVREMSRRIMNETPQRGRWTAQDQPSCPNRYVLEYLGNPTGGDATLQLYGTYGGVDLADDMNAVIPWDATLSEIKDLLEAANGYDPEADPVTGFEVTVSLGPLPNNDVVILLPRGVKIRVIDNGLTPESITRYAKIRV